MTLTWASEPGWSWGRHTSERLEVLCQGRSIISHEKTTGWMAPGLGHAVAQQHHRASGTFFSAQTGWGLSVMSPLTVRRSLQQVMAL